MAGKKSFSVKVEKFTIFPDGISWKKIARIHETLTIELQIKVQYQNDQIESHQQSQQNGIDIKETESTM